MLTIIPSWGSIIFGLLFPRGRDVAPSPDHQSFPRACCQRAAADGASVPRLRMLGKQRKSDFGHISDQSRFGFYISYLSIFLLSWIRSGHGIQNTFVNCHLHQFSGFSRFMRKCMLDMLLAIGYWPLADGYWLLAVG